MFWEFRVKITYFRFKKLELKNWFYENGDILWIDERAGKK